MTTLGTIGLICAVTAIGLLLTLSARFYYDASKYIEDGESVELSDMEAVGDMHEVHITDRESSGSEFGLSPHVRTSVHGQGSPYPRAVDIKINANKHDEEFVASESVPLLNSGIDSD